MAAWGGISNGVTPRFPAGFQAAGLGGVERAAHVGIAGHPAIEHQIVHARAAELDGAVVILQPRGIVRRAGKAGHQADDGDGEDRGGDDHFEQRNSAGGLHSPTFTFSMRGNPVIGSRRTMRRLLCRFTSWMPIPGTARARHEDQAAELAVAALLPRQHAFDDDAFGHFQLAREAGLVGHHDELVFLDGDDRLP